MPTDWSSYIPGAPVEPPKRNAISAGLSSGVDDLQGLGYSAVGAVADTLKAKGVRDWANEQADRNQWESQRNGRPDLDRVEDVYDSPSKYLPYLGYQVAKQVPNLAGAIGAGLLMPAVAVPAALSRGAAMLPRAVGGGGLSSRVAAAAAEGGSEFAARRAALEAGQTFGKQVIGGGAFNYGQGVGSLYQESVDGGDPDSGAMSLLGGVPYAVTETLPQAMLVGRLGYGSGFKGGLPLRMLKAGATQGVTGVVSEGLQNEMEMAYNGSVSPEDAFSRRLNSMTAGGLVEGVLGSFGGVRRNRARSVDSAEQTDLLNPGEFTATGEYDLQRPLANTAPNPLGDLTPDWETEAGARDLTQYDSISPTGLIRSFDDPAAGRIRLSDDPAVPTGRVAGSLDVPLVDGRPGFADTMLVGRPGEVASTDAQNTAMLDPGATEARRQYLVQQEKNAADAKAIEDAETKYAEKRAAATEALVDKDADGTRPIKVKPREIGTHGTLTALKEAGTITPEVYSDLVGRVREALKANDTKTLNTVAKEVKALAAPAPAATTPKKPTTPNVVINAAGPATQGGAVQSVASGVKPSVPAAPIAEPTNQLLQGTPDGSVAAMAGQRPGGSSVGGSADAGTGVADAGRDVDTAVGVPAPADGVGAVAGQAGTVSDAATGGSAPAVSEAAPDVVVGTGNPNVEVKTKKTRKAALGTDERRADILARIQEAKASTSKLSGVKGKQSGGIDVGLLALYAELAADHIIKTGRNFAEFSKRMVADLGDEAAPYLRQLHTEAQSAIRKDVKAVAVERTPDGAPVMLESKNANGDVVGYTVKLKGKTGVYIRRDAESGQLVLVPERSGLAKQDTPVYLGEKLSEAIDELPYAYGLLKTGRKIKEASGKTAVEFAPENKAVVGGSIDFDLLQKATEGKPQYLKSIYLYLGIDTDGTRLTGKPMSANAAARDGGWGKNSGQNLTKAMNALGISDEVQTRFMQSDQLAPPLPGESLALSVKERLDQAAEQDDGSREQYVDDRSDSRGEDVRGIEEGARGAGAFEDEANVGTEDSSDGTVLERFNEGISTISSVGGSSIGTEKILNTNISSVKQFKSLVEAVKKKLPLDSFPTAQLLAAFQKVTKHVLPDVLEGTESETVIGNAYANEEFMVGVVEELKSRDRRAYGSPAAREELRKARAAHIRDLEREAALRREAYGDSAAQEEMRKARAENVRELEKEGTLIRDKNKGRSKTTAERDEEFVAGLARDDKGNFDEANSTQADADQASVTESLLDSGREEDEEAGRAIDEQLGNADTANDRRGNEDQVSDGTRYRSTANTPPSKAISRGALDQIVRSVQRFLAGRVKVTVMDDVTAYDPTQTPGSRAGVLTPKGEIILFRSGIADGVAGMKTVFHELLHKGLRALYSPGEYRQVMNYLYQSDARIRAAADEWLVFPENQRDIQGRPEVERRALAVDEVLAEFAETTQPTVLRALGNWLARIAAKMGMPELARAIRTMGLSDLQAFVSDALAAATRVRRDIEAETRARPGTSAFKRWFGDSKVVDENGEPLVVYHGTTKDFSAFQRVGGTALQKLARQLGVGRNSGTYFFAADPAFAGSYGGQNGGLTGGNIMPVYLSIKNPLVWENNKVESLAQAMRRAARDGHDGVLAKQWHEPWLRDVARQPVPPTDVYIALDSRQIKSATGNNGNYDPTNPDIRYSTTNRSARTQSVATAEKAIRAYPAALRPAARAVHRVLGKYARGALNTVMFTEDLMNRAIDLGMKSAKAYKDLANQKESFTGSYERRVLNTVSGYTDLPEKIKGKGPGTVNAFLQDSQMQSEFAGKWGYQPSWLDKVEIDPKAKAAYEALGDKGMAYADSVFKLGHDTLALKKQTVIESTTSEYDVLIAAATKDGNTQEAEELTAEKVKTLEQFGTMMKLGGKFPYSPVKRFGNYVVVAESQKYMDAKRAGDTKLMRQLEGDPNEYFVDFAESDGDAQKIEDELRATGLYVDPGYRPRETMRDDLYGGSNTLKALSKLRERAAAMPEATSQDKQTKEAATKLRTLLTDLYLMQLAEGSSRKSEMKRRGVAGNIDMIRSLETQGKADAHFLGSVKFGGKMLESIGEMRKEMRDGSSDQRLRRSEVLNEVIARHMQSMDYKETPLVDALRMVPSVFFLAMSPSYYIQNALQPFMLSLPLMAAKHGYGKTSKALVDAYTSVAPAFKNADVFKQIDFDALLASGNTALTKDEKVLVQSLLDSGRLDIGMATEFGSLRADGDGKVSAAWNKARDGLQGLQSKMEALNRLSTALAAFRLESGSGAVKATEYADRVIQETHGDYNAQNAPRAFNTAWGKVGLQFKKYQLIQLTLMAKLLKNSFGEAKTKEEKDARTLARKALTYTMGQAAVIGGGKALPIPFVVAWLFGAAFGDDSDEPPEYVLRQMIGNKDIADLLISGPLSFAGINGSGLGGFGNAVAALPFVDVDLTSREGVMETAFAIGAGPLGGLSLKTADAVGAMTNGDYFKGLGMLLPKGPGSLIKAGEQMANGIYQRDGDTTMSADEISGWASLQQGLGFTPQQTLERQYRQQSAYKIDASMRDQNAEIKRMYSRALKNGESTAEAKEAWIKYQAKRVNMGYERQPMSELTKSAKTQSEREKETVGGVQYRKSNREFVENLGRN